MGENLPVFDFDSGLSGDKRTSKLPNLELFAQSNDLPFHLCLHHVSALNNHGLSRKKKMYFSEGSPVRSTE